MTTYTSRLRMAGKNVIDSLPTIIVGLGAVYEAVSLIYTHVIRPRQEKVIDIESHDEE